MCVRARAHARVCFVGSVCMCACVSVYTQRQYVRAHARVLTEVCVCARMCARVCLVGSVCVCVCVSVYTQRKCVCVSECTFNTVIQIT